VAFLLESIVEETELSQEEAQKLWNEEATKLDAGDQTPAFEIQASVPETPPQEIIEPEGAQGQAADPLAGLPEEVKIALGKITQLEQANAQLLHHVKTAEGRVAAIQREFQQGRQVATSVDTAPSQGQMAAAAKNPEKWEQLKQDFPEWAGAMEEYVGSKLNGMQSGVQATQVMEYVQQQLAVERENMKTALEEARVEGRYENWRDTVNTPEFAQWFAIQSNEVKALADSSAARDAIKMLDMFHKLNAKSAPEIKQERGARLAAAATTRPGQTPPPKTLDDMSPEELWNYEAKKREDQLAKRGY
jgi:cytochrome c553